MTQGSSMGWGFARTPIHMFVKNKKVQYVLDIKLE